MSQIVACTATADRNTLREIKACLGMKESTVLVSMPIYRHNLSLYVTNKHPREGEVDLVRAIRSSCAPRVLVFCRKREETQRVVKLLTQNDISATFYHSAVADREAVLQTFASGATVVTRAC